MLIWTIKGVLESFTQNSYKGVYSNYYDTNKRLHI